MAIVEYPPVRPFPGVIGRTADESSPAWPAPVRRQTGAPNVLFIVLDDTGFGQLGCYGSPIATPNLDRLAASGLRYNNMHTTALCSPTRSCIAHRPQPPLERDGLHHRARDRLSRATTASSRSRTASSPRCCCEHGYNTYMVGKWHLTPSNQETAAGPYDRWPLGRGFERFYGFLGGDTSQWYPDLVYDNHQVEPPTHARGGLPPHRGPGRQARSSSSPTPSRSTPDKPFFLYFCSGATHAPHHVPKEWADKYAGSSTTAGTPTARRCSPGRRSSASCRRTPSCRATTRTCPTGTSLPADARRLYARMMEVFAGFLEPHRPPHRPAARLPASDRASSTTR